MFIPQGVDDIVTKSLAFKVKVTRTVERGIVVAGVLKEDDSFECCICYEGNAAP
ncbi:hypothetical protein TanjilG_06672 [Lupinus angustifolius]|uniref:Uncharacterized protein n=1 Tax=Lupinus angustifolius TaxID=3871 RepID=A0A1J7I066_LUPAN|nr:hypothetical protein TanjilG_06672 [Lupinus angustifolius]